MQPLQPLHSRGAQTSCRQTRGTNSTAVLPDTPLTLSNLFCFNLSSLAITDSNLTLSSPLLSLPLHPDPHPRVEHRDGSSPPDCTASLLPLWSPGSLRDLHHSIKSGPTQLRTSVASQLWSQKLRLPSSVFPIPGSWLPSVLAGRHHARRQEARSAGVEGNVMSASTAPL